ncbi:MAG: type II toxin-antitoxin system YafQ family toxin [Burkholderiales bacterium]|nr:type II toxin-antitoxin system YafQ family toxin [Burkholderiales bacterium]
MGGDFLLIYQVADKRINFVRAGMHSELFSI